MCIPFYITCYQNDTLFYRYLILEHSEPYVLQDLCITTIYCKSDTRHLAKKQKNRATKKEKVTMVCLPNIKKLFFMFYKLMFRNFMFLNFMFCNLMFHNHMFYKLMLCNLVSFFDYSISVSSKSKSERLESYCKGLMRNRFMQKPQKIRLVAMSLLADSTVCCTERTAIYTYITVDETTIQVPLFFM